MIQFSDFSLNNGLRILVHEDPTTPMAVVNLTYNVGSKDEDENLTGFAHLFEHLMFGGSENIPSFDGPVQEVGGECNAFTSPDITNYYITLPAANLETAFWLESDRMSALSINERTLEIQRKVVIEEFNQRYLNQPYGDLWLKTLPLAYRIHPYRWATIGKDISHIAEASLADVQAFYQKFYCPANAVLTIAGDVTTEQISDLAEKWFGDLPGGQPNQRNLPLEPVQTAPRTDSVEANVPLDAIIRAYHMPGRFSDGYYAADIVCDILGRGKSSRLYQKLVNEKGIFNSLNSQTLSTIDPGLLIIRGFINPGVDIIEADAAITEVIRTLQTDGPAREEATRARNQKEATLEFSEIEMLHRAMNLGYAAVAGNPDWVNDEISRIHAVKSESIHLAANDLLRNENSSTLYYRKAK